MIRQFELCRFGFILSVAGVVAAAPVAFAEGIVAYRNETKQAIVVQSAVVVNGTIKMSKPQTLFPGESAVDSLTRSGPRRIVIYDARKPNNILLQTDVAFTGDAFYAIVSRPKPAGQADTKPATTLEIVKVNPPASLTNVGGNLPSSPRKR
ncbi:MAG: hypothetical protein N2039_02975 [Gemmataceae bacterium]|nr:hypothetical protein [Gemmataceae bacterium]